MIRIRNKKLKMKKKHTYYIVHERISFQKENML